MASAIEFASTNKIDPSSSDGEDTYVEEDVLSNSEDEGVYDDDEDDNGYNESDDDEYCSDESGSSSCFSDLATIFEETTFDLEEEDLSRCSMIDSFTRTQTHADVLAFCNRDDRWEIGGCDSQILPLMIVSSTERRRCRSLDRCDDFSMEDDNSTDDSYPTTRKSVLDDLRRFKIDMDFSPVSLAKSKSGSMNSRTTCTTASSLSDEDDPVLEYGVSFPVFSSGDFDIGKVDGARDTLNYEENICHISVLSSERSCSNHSSNCSQPSVLAFGPGIASSQSTFAMDIIDESSIVFSQSLSILSPCLEKRYSEETLSTNRFSKSIDTTLAARSFKAIQRRRMLEQLGGEGRKRAYRKSKVSLQHKLEKSSGRLPPPLGAGCYLLVAESSDQKEYQQVLECLGGLHRSKNFADAKERLDISLRKRQQGRPLLERAHSYTTCFSSSNAIQSRSLKRSQSLVLRTSRHELSGIPVLSKDSQHSKTPNKRLFLLRHRLGLEHFGGQRRRLSFRRAKEVLAKKLEPILLRRLVRHRSVKSRGRSERDQTSKNCSCVASVKRGRSTATRLQTADDRPRERTKKGREELQRQKSYRQSRDIFQKQGPFVSWSPRPKESSCRQKPLTALFLKNGLSTFDDLSQFR